MMVWEGVSESEPSVRCRSSQLAAGLVLSSYGRLLVVLMMVWEYHVMAATLLNLFVVMSNMIVVRGMTMLMRNHLSCPLAPLVGDDR